MLVPAMPSTSRRAIALAACLLLASGAVHAQAYPDRPIRLIVGYAPGGTTDFTARVVGPKLSEALGQTVVIDNRPGAGSIIGTDLVAKASPDGYTLLLADTAFGIVPAIYARHTFDSLKDFVPVMQITSMPNLLVVHPSVPARSMKELVVLAKSRPNQLTFGSGGVGTPLHMGGEQLKVATGIDIVHVPYKGAAPAMTDLLGGQLTMIFPTLTLGVPPVKAGRLRALAVTSRKRIAVLPDVPTTAEAGYADVNATSWFGLVAPAKTPRAIVDRLHAELVRVLKQPDVRERFEAQYADIVGGTPQDLSKFVAAELAQWRRIAKAGHIRAE
jgi:tripartite-type tricarboxylate transporter receptor subunit TctC